MTVVGRIAPSPTGYLHLGHARSFLLAWWSVRSQGGKVVLRIEDLDVQRSQPKYVDACLRDLEWLGLDWDVGPRVQSEGLDRILACAEQLMKAGLAYPCICSRRDVQASQSAPHRGEQEMRYPGTCRGRFANLEAASAHSGAAGCLRFLVQPGLVTVDDVLAGPHRFDVSDEVGDFPILRRDQSPAYQLAVVVDDQYDGVTEVLRGNDLLASAARQQLIYQALGLRIPRWIHVPLVVDQQGRRLAKRTDALSLAHLRQRGMRARDVVAWVANSIGISVGPLDSVRDVTPHFQQSPLATEPVAVSEDDLLSAGLV
jgi:glutamyl-tRNA synthetase